MEIFFLSWRLPDEWSLSMWMWAMAWIDEHQIRPPLFEMWRNCSISGLIVECGGEWGLIALFPFFLFFWGLALTKERLQPYGSIFRIYLKKNIKKRKGSWWIPPVWPYHRDLQRRFDYYEQIHFNCLRRLKVYAMLDSSLQPNYNNPTGGNPVYSQGVINITWDNTMLDNVL